MCSFRMYMRNLENFQRFLLPAVVEITEVCESEHFLCSCLFAAFRFHIFAYLIAVAPAISGSLALLLVISIDGPWWNIICASYRVLPSVCHCLRVMCSIVTVEAIALICEISAGVVLPAVDTLQPVMLMLLGLPSFPVVKRTFMSHFLILLSRSVPASALEMSMYSQ